jgi:hypothetical protein
MANNKLFALCHRESSKPAQVASWILLVIIAIAAVYSLRSGFYDMSILHQILLCTLPLIFLISFLNINFALSILIISMLLSPGLSMGNVPGRAIALRFDDITLLIVFFGWITRMAVHKDLGFLRLSPINKPIAAYIGICLVSTLFGSLSGAINIKHAIFYILKYIEYFIIFFMVSNNIRDEKQIKMFIKVMIATCVVVCIYGLYSYFSLGLRATPPFEGEGGEANTMAGYLVVMMPVVIACIASATKGKTRFILSAILALQITTLLYTLSRTGWLGMIVTIAMLIFMVKKGRVILFPLLAIAIVVAPMFTHKIVHNRINETFVGKDTIKVMGHRFTVDDSTNSRLISARRSIAKWGKSPIIGQGVTSAGAVSDVQYTRILCEVGLVGLTIFIWLVVVLMQTGLKSYRLVGVGVFGRNISAAFISSLTGLIVMGMAAEVFIIIRIMEPFWFIAALVANLPEITEVLPVKAPETAEAKS